MTYTLGGKVLTIDPAPTFTAVPDGGTLGSGQNYLAYLPDTPTGYPGIIFNHTAGGDQTIIQNSVLAQRLASYGFACVAGEDGGITTWGNDASRADIDEVFAYLIDEGASETQVGFIGFSMGLVSALSWISNGNEDLAFAVASVVGVSSMQHAHDVDAGLATSMDQAYGSEALWEAALPDRDPTELAAANVFTGLPVRQLTGAQDLVCTTATATTLATEIGSTAIVVEDPGDHIPTLFGFNRPAVSSYMIGKFITTARARSLVT